MRKMIKNFKIEIDCAVCASKVEDAIKKIDPDNLLNPHSGYAL